MSRSLSFGYNGVAALSETAADRLFRAEFESGTISDTLTFAFADQNLHGVAHARLSRPELSIDQATPEKVRISFDVEVVLAFNSAPSVAGLQAEERLDASVAISVRTVAVGYNLRVLLASVQETDVSVSGVSSGNALIGAIAPALIRRELPAALHSGTFAQTDIALGLTTQASLADSIDMVVVNDPSPADRDEVVLGFYRDKDPASRGQTKSLGPILPPGLSAEVRISRAAFDILAQERLDDRYMRYVVRAGLAEDERRRKLEFLYQPTVFGGSTDQVYRLTGLPDGNRGSVVGSFTVQGGIVPGHRVGVPQPLTVASDGTFAWNATESAETIFRGNDLHFHGDYLLQSGAKVFPPAFELVSNGIKVSGQAQIDIACYDDVSLDYSLDVKLDIDPASGDLISDIAEPEIDLPCYADALIVFAKAVVLIVGGPAAGIILGDMRGDTEGEMTGTVDSEIAQLQSALFPSLGTASRARMFWEELTLSKEGLQLGGQLEAGWIKGGARSPGLSAEIDAVDSGGYRYAQELVVENGYAWLRGSTAHDDQTGISRVVDLTFEQLDARSLADRSYHSHIVSVPQDQALAGTCLAIRTAWGRYAKARIDQDKSGRFWTRWITYHAAPRPSAIIVGDWTHTGTTPENARCVGQFTVKTEQLYSAYGLQTTWHYDGPGVAAPIPGSPGAFTVEIDIARDLPASSNAPRIVVRGYELPGSVRGVGTLSVEVEDIFGSRATGERVMWCEVKHGEEGLGLTLRPDIDISDLFRDRIGPSRPATLFGAGNGTHPEVTNPVSIGGRPR